MPGIDELASNTEKLEQVTLTLNLVSGIYDQSAHMVAFHRGPLVEDEE